ncbi:carrier with solute carrier repeats [Schizosaccharomyces cryophilus OY26]|uniref:Mitochondrial glycine transporter n=1 Tax=Schizosaccharomyces cryophilus (strain OY26 / ATCC MYA-4695 / CBS 11777 / NBRC 106824 / NRRL Y48691) TaxID=653667 RepID=S9X5S2_SCHCR|nr:carrier with solute carrier repeats [Schizosaccharomyces cryophilus OY26]EPY52417.1 carrier with solute carrier repeats [Schizosaccharomyces cryophilus OY26]
MSQSANAVEPKQKNANHLRAGALGGFISSAALQPLDLLKTRLQQSQHLPLPQIIQNVVRKEGGITSLWKGTFPSILRSTTGSSCYFYVLNSLRRYNPQSNSSSLKNSQNFWIGGFSRAIVGFVFMPVTVIKVRYESNYYSYTTIGSSIKSIWKKEGIAGFFHGFGVTALRDAPHAGIYVYFYELSKETIHNLLGHFQDTPSGAVPQNPYNNSVNVLSGMISGTIATAITNPFDMLKTRVQLQPDIYKNFFYCARRVYMNEGFYGFLDGLALRVLRKSVSSTITWSVYEWAMHRNDT